MCASSCIELLEYRKAGLATTCSRKEKSVIAAKAEKTNSDDVWLNPKRLLHVLEERGCVNMRKKAFHNRKPNSYRFEDGYTVIICNSGVELKIDPEDYERVCPYTCYATKKQVSIQTESGAISLSRFLCPSVSPKRKISHKNKDSYDFRKENLFFGNVYTKKDDYLLGECFDGSTFKIDCADYDLVSPYVWHIDSNGYVITKHNGKIIKQHRLILGLIDSPDVEVDHLFHDTTDNRRAFIRPITRSGNCINRRIAKSNKSGTSGVYWSISAKKWCAQINKNGSRYYLGSFENLEDAISARKTAEQIYHLDVQQQSAISSQASNRGRFND